MKASLILYKLKELETFEKNNSYDDIKEYVKFFKEKFGNVDTIDQHQLEFFEGRLLQAFADYTAFINKTKWDFKNIFFSTNENYQKISEEIWDQSFARMPFEDHIKWLDNWKISDESLERFINLMQCITGWESATVLIGAKTIDLIKSISYVAPYYIVERFSEYFELQKATFSPEDARRMLWYNQSDIDKLPDNAIGTIIIYNEFPFMPFSMSSEILKILTNKIRPGGSLLFTYNDCNTVIGFENFENKNMVYTTSDMFDSLLADNFTLFEKYNAEGDYLSYLCYRKKGETKHIKKLPPVGYIKVQPTLETPDHQTRIEQIQKLVKERNT